MNTIPTSYSDQEVFYQRSSIKAAVVWGLAAIFYFYELMLLVSPSVMLDDLMKTFSTNAEQLGSLAAFYYYAYASMQIPVGLLMDRFGPRILLTLACCFCAIGCLIFGFAPTLWLAQVGRFVMGIGGSFAVVGCLKLASLWFPVNRFALLTGIMVAVGMMGGVFGQAPVAKLVMHVGWRQTSLWGALIGGLLAIVIWFVVSDYPLKSDFKKKAASLPPFSQEVNIWIKFAIVLVLFFFPLWMMQFLPEKQDGRLFLLFYIGWFFCQLLYRRSNKESKSTLSIGLLGLLGGTYLILTHELHFTQFALAALSLGFFARLIFSKTLPIPAGLYEVMKIPQVWIASLYAGLMFVPTTGFGQLWGVPYFTERFHIEKDAAGLMVSMIFFGWAFGGPFYGWISDRIGRRKLPMGFAAFSTIIVMTAILYAPASVFQMKVLMFLLGAFSSGFILAFSIVREINAPMLTGTAIGFINTLNNASGALAQPVVGKLLDKQWDGNILPDGNPMYSLQMYNEALLFLPVCIVFALFLVPFIRETFCRPSTTRID
ncbi:MAG: MFS transporter [Proteobacteria bacterium]|nr:MFS transporter [Pseudomonadota bacterium]